MDERFERGIWRPRFRVFLLAWSAAMLLVLLWQLTSNGLSGVAVPVGNVVVPVLLLFGTRTGTTADADGVTIASALRMRRIPWTDIEEIRPVQSQWEDPKVDIQLSGGSTRTLPCVGLDDARQLEELRARASA